MSFTELQITTDREQALDAFVAKMQELFPGWAAAEGDLLLWFAEWVADEYPDLANLAREMGELAFAQWGEQMFGIAPLAATSASAQTTWTLTDTDGHTIEAGTQVQIADGDDLYAFAVVEEVAVAAGSSVTSAGAVEIAAILTGEQANGLTEDPTLIDAIAFVDSIALVGSTSGGVDAEDPADYLDRLRAELEVLSQVLILPADVATAARRVAGVARATVVDGYDPDTNTFDNEKTVTVYPIDEDGANVSAGVKSAIETVLEAGREVNFVFHVDDPSRTTIKVSTNVIAWDGVDLDGLETSITAALTSYLTPSNWGLSPTDDDPGIWINEDTVYIRDLVAVVKNVEGVRHVTSLTAAEQAGVLATTDIVMSSASAPAPLPEAGTITVNASL